MYFFWETEKNRMNFDSSKTLLRVEKIIRFFTFILEKQILYSNLYICMIKLYKTNGEDIIDYHTVRD
jgi:hypothetical protein